MTLTVPVSRRMFQLFLKLCCLGLLAFCPWLSGCAGYHLGTVNAYGIHSIHVNVFKNKVLVPRIEEQMSNAVVRQFQIDGSIHIASPDQADAIMDGEIIAWERHPLRFQKKDLLVTREYRLVIAAHITVKDKQGKILVDRKRLEGETTFFIGDDLVASERQALPVAADDLAKNIVEQVVEGW